MSSGDDSVPAGYYGCSGADVVVPAELTGEEAAAAANFLEMFGDYTGDLFELARRQGGGEEEKEEAAAMEQVQPQPAATSSSSPAPAPVTPAVVRELKPPSEEEMAAWLYPIVRGDQPPAERTAPVDDLLHLPPENKQAAEELLLSATKKTTSRSKGRSSDSGGERTSSDDDSGDRRKTAPTRARRSHNSRTHSLIEKRRRCKVNERLKTLRQLVPGCHKSNQASMLEQTIQYMKSLQQQVQAMSVGLSIPMAAPPFVGTAAPPPPMPIPSLVAAPAAAGMMIPVAPFVGVPPSPMLPLVRHPAVVVVPAQFCAPPETVSDNITPASCSKNNTRNDN